jgi:hypothetical protein
MLLIHLGCHETLKRSGQDAGNILREAFPVTIILSDRGD